MPKVLHLVCNSHIDPVWQWDWDEGVSSALSTFYAACNLLDEYDFIFCHNEVILYEYIEKYDPELFKRIEKLVEIGKWKIMGGWYIQPDCLVPSGESFIRQASLGREYFKEKFNQRPTTALNFDSFGHTKGLPQILKKCGFDSYIFLRPMIWNHPSMKEDVPYDPFIWEGYDGSKVKALRYNDPECNYTSRLGYAKEDILRKANYYKDYDQMIALWGVGNHGGTSSKKDLEDIIELMDEKKGEYVIKHSTLEDYFDSVNPTIIEKRQLISFIKSYSSVHAIKLVHDQLENALYMSEKVCSVASLQNKYQYDKEVFKNAEKVLCQIEFHDVLSGTAIKLGTDSSIRKAHSAIDSLKKEMFKAFNAISKDLKKVTPNNDNIVIFNPYPYDYDGLVEVEFHNIYSAFYNEMLKMELYDINGKRVEFQKIREESLIAHPKRIRMIFNAHIDKMSVTSYEIHSEVVKEVLQPLPNQDEVYLKDSRKEVRISKKTGLLESFIVDGIEYIKKPAFAPYEFMDNPDPWGWRMNNLTMNEFNEISWPKDTKTNTLKAFKSDNSGKGPFSNLKNVTVLEDGKYLMTVQSLFKLNNSFVVIMYKLYKDTPYIDVNVHVLWNEASKGLKLELPVKNAKECYSQMAFGLEKYSNDGLEYPANRYTYVKKNNKALTLYNRSGVHSLSMIKNSIYFTLLNGAAYCCHPTDEFHPLLCDERRYVPYVEQGVSDFEFRLRVNDLSECEKYSNEFNQPLYSLSYFPHGDNTNIIKNTIELSNNDIVISALKLRKDDTYLIRLYNGTNSNNKTTLSILDKKIDVKFKRFEFKTFIYDHKTIKESSDASIY